ncbi:putative ADP-ribosylation factor [Platanthera zijinensis]|uniref:ADP-ribosylation factor n=1 Tax=Platanthera zijinensis TaxID=2320716 RepID=A0AAP0FXJ7_9ASPA
MNFCIMLLCRWLLVILEESRQPPSQRATPCFVQFLTQETSQRVATFVVFLVIHHRTYLIVAPYCHGAKGPLHSYIQFFLWLMVLVSLELLVSPDLGSRVLNVVGPIRCTSRVIVCFTALVIVPLSPFVARAGLNAFFLNTSTMVTTFFSLRVSMFPHLDIQGSLKPKEIAKILNLGGMDKSRHWNIVGCGAYTGKGLFQGFDWVVQDIAD